MKTKSLSILLIFILICGCSPKVDPVAEKTNIAETVEAESISMMKTIQAEATSTVTLMPTETSTPTVTPFPTPTYTPTNPPGYCDPEWAERSILKLEELLGQGGDGSQSSDESFADLTEAEVLVIQATIKAKVLEAKLLMVPPCLQAAKDKTVAALEGFDKLFNPSPDVSEDEMLGLFFGIGFTIQEAEDEISKIKQCLPTGCKE